MIEPRDRTDREPDAGRLRARTCATGAQVSPTRNKALGIDRRDSVLKLGGVIPVCAERPAALDDRVSHDHADHVSAAASKALAACEPIEPAQPLERPGHETDNARPLGHETTGQRSPGRPPIAQGGHHRAGRGDAIVLDPEVVAILDGEEMALPVGRSPRQVALLEIEQLDGVGRASPMNVRGRSVGGDLGGEIVLAGVEVVVEEVDPGRSGRV